MSKDPAASTIQHGRQHSARLDRVGVWLAANGSGDPLKFVGHREGLVCKPLYRHGVRVTYTGNILSGIRADPEKMGKLEQFGRPIHGRHPLSSGNYHMLKIVLSSARQKDTQKRIEAQQLVVASLRPGTAEHRLSVKVLLLLQDALHLLVETEAMLADARRKRSMSGA